MDAREFMYDSPRQRYLSRPIDPETLGVFVNEPNDVPADVPANWTDYLGQSVLADATVMPQGEVAFSFDPQRRYAGDAFEDLDPDGDPQWTRYRHGDLIDSTVLATETAGGTGFQPVASAAYTAFGELLGGSGFQPENLGTRYQYAGGWGYETGLLEIQGANTSLPAIQLMHVGARWYQPDSGRFVQRDPVGIPAGPNSYAYTKSDPLAFIDGSGNNRISIVIRAANGAWRAWIGRNPQQIGLRDLCVQGPGAKAVGKSLAKKRWPGRDIVFHGGHRLPDGRTGLAHWQVRSGGMGHIFVETLDCILPPLILCPPEWRGWPDPTEMLIERYFPWLGGDDDELL